MAYLDATLLFIMKPILILLVPYFLVLGSCVVHPPMETGNFKNPDLVELIKLDTAIHLDIRYATTNNFTHQKMYAEARAFLQKPAALALLEVKKELEPLGYGLVIFDGYRPWEVTRNFWKATTGKDRSFVADPKKGSKHNRGCAVDLSLYDLRTGEEIEMTSDYDEMSERAYPNYQGGTSQQHKMRDLLISAMESHGFKVLKNEWWHYDYKDWSQYTILNIPFSAI